MPKVSVERVSMVTPAKPTSPHFMALSELDLMWLPVKNMRRVIFFKTDTPYSLVGDQLKKALSSVLVDFYPLAGRLSVCNDQSDSNKKPLIHCNDEGVEFIEATMDCSFEALSLETDEHSALFNLLAPPLAQLSASHVDSPLLSLQVTSFSSGGFCIGTAFQHVMGDGTSIWHFINSWAEISRGMPCISTKPFHHRTIYNPPPNNKRIVAHAVVAKADELKEAKIIKLTDEEQQNNDERPSGYHRTDNNPDDEELLKASFIIDRDNIKNIKDKSQARSSFLAVVAHAWRSMMIARQADENQQAFLGILADCRGRVEPPLPPSYFGNFLTYCGIKVSVKRLLSEDLSFAVKVVEECVAVCATEEQLRLSVQLGSDNVPSCFMKEFKGVYIVFVSGYHRFPMYDCDFGWGKPARVDVADMDPPGNMSTLLISSPPPNQHNAMQISICLPVSQMQCFRDLLLNIHT